MRTWEVSVIVGSLVILRGEIARVVVMAENPGVVEVLCAEAAMMPRSILLNLKK